jgi:hypothetical protein
VSKILDVHKIIDGYNNGVTIKGTTITREHRNLISVGNNTNISYYRTFFTTRAIIQSTDHELIPARMRVLRQSKVPRAEVMFVTIQRENIDPPRKK